MKLKSQTRKGIQSQTNKPNTTFSMPTAPLPKLQSYKRTPLITDIEKELIHKSTSQVSNTDFVKAWMTCKTVKQVAEKLGLNRSQVSAKAGDLRKKGVTLPTKQSNYVDPNSVEALNKIVKRYSK